MSASGQGSTRDAVRWGLLLGAVGVSGYRLPGMFRNFQQWRARVSNQDFSVVGGRVFLQQASAVSDPDLVARLHDATRPLAIGYRLRARGSRARLATSTARLTRTNQAATTRTAESDSAVHAAKRRALPLVTDRDRWDMSSFSIPGFDVVGRSFVVGAMGGAASG